MSWSRGNWFRCLSWVVVYLLFFDTLAASTLRYLPGGGIRTAESVVSAAQEPALGLAGRVLHVSAADATCGGSTPCFRTIQAAIDAANPGDKVLVRSGLYSEQLRIFGKNRQRGASESDRIVIEADPSAAWGSVVVGPPPGARCPKGPAVDIKGSSFVTLRGLALRNAGGRGVVLRGQGPANQAIHIERNRIYADGDSRCSRGISIWHGNDDTLVANNLIDGTDREGIYVADDRGGEHTIVSNTLYRNRLGGILLARRHRALIVNNLIVGNGEDRSSRRTGIQRRGRSAPESAVLRGNLVCGNLPGELKGPLLDEGDAGNATPTGSEGPGVAASPDCDDLERVFAGVLDEERAAAHDAEDFGLADDSPAIDAGVPLLEALPNVPAASLRADLTRATVRPLDGDDDGEADYDIGAIEADDAGEPTPTPAPSASPSPPASPSPSPSSTPAPTGSPTPTSTPTPIVGPTASPTASPTPGPTPVPGEAPFARDDSYEFRQVETLQVGAPGVLANDEDPDGDSLTAALVDPPAIGTLSAFNPDGSFTYEPPPEFVPPTLNPGVLMRTPVSYSGFAQVADFNHDGKLDVAYSNFGRLEALDGGNFRSSSLWIFDPSITTRVNVSGCSFFNSSTFAVGDIDESGDVSLVLPANCDDTVNGAPDRYVAINGSEVTAGKVGASWVTERLTKPHPDAWLNQQASGPANPPIRPAFFGSSFTEPTLARLEAAGGVKLLARHLVGPGQGPYLTKNDQGAFVSRFAGCRSLTGLAADEGRLCRATYVIDAADGTIEDVLVSPNPSSETDTGSWRPWRKNAPIVADLDGDGAVEIIAGSDVWKQIGDDWELAWQTNWEPTSVAVADLDGDGTSEVVQHRNNFAGRTFADAGIFIYAHDGALIRRIAPKNPQENSFGFVTLSDADGDGATDILYTVDGILYVYRSDGRLLWVFLVPDRPQPLNGLVPGAVGLFGRTGETAPQVYDLDLDGKPEVLLNAAARLFIFEGATGAEKWSIDTEGGPFGPKSLALADFDGDGHVDIFAMSTNRWNCSTTTGGPVPCLGNAVVVSGQDDNWAPGPEVFNQIHFRPDAVDDDAKILFAPAVRREFRRAEQEGAVVDPRLKEGTLFTYTASDGASSSNVATAFIEINPENNPPEITSLPPTGLLSKTPYTRPVYQITATDKDPGDTIHYELVSSTHPFGHSAPWGTGFGINLDAATGAMDFYVGPCGSFGGGCDFGDVVVTVAAIDSLGLRDEQAFVVTIGPFQTTVPTVIGSLLEAAISALQAASLRARVILELFDASPAGTVLDQTPAGGTTGVAIGTSVDLTVSKGPEPRPTPSPSPTPDPNATPTPEPTAGPPLESIVVEPSSPIILVNGTQVFTATGVFEDGTSADLTTQVSWSIGTEAAASISSAGVATGLGAGSSTITASIDGIDGSTTLTVLARVPSDFEEPIAEITSPASGADVTAPVPVTGTAADPFFQKYELALAPAGEDTFTIIATGAAPVTDGVLGELDPTLLINDQYTLRLTVFDRGGNQTKASVTVQVDGGMKVGPFTLSFDDVTVPASGLPVGAVRVYDSRDKRSGDFGVGWRLDLQTIRIRANRVLGTGWARFVSGAFVLLEPTDAHKVSVTLPDGRVEEFDLQIDPTSQIGSLDATIVTGFTPRPGTRGRLEALANPSLLVVNAGAEEELLDDDNLETYDPKRYRYTSFDGTSVEVDLELGVQKVTDPNGNQLVIGPNGITHSAGKSISFVRDAEDRITQITDPRGKTQLYGYDARGDLVSHTDPLGNVTTFAYDRRHNLIRIRDPLGRPVARNEYDDAGRLIKLIDAKGNEITLDHDIPGRLEVVTDRNGHATVSSYDERGNVLTSTNALGEKTSFTYDGRDNPITMTDPLNRTTTYTYDANDRPTSVENAAGKTVTMTYDTRGNQLTATDERGHTSMLTYDAKGNLTSVKNQLGHGVTHTDDSAGNVLTITDAVGQVITREYEPSGAPKKLTDEMGRVIQFGNDANGNLLSQTDDTGLVQMLEYDDRNRPTSIEVAGGARTVVYDDAGQITALTTASGQTTTLGYDELGQVASISVPGGGATAAAQRYDAEGNVIETTDRLGNETTYEYDAEGRLLKTTYPNGSTEKKTYDAAGQLKTETDRSNRTTSYDYDELGRLIEIVDPLGNVTTRDYDDSGNLIAETDPLLHTTTYEYDDANRLVRTNFPDGKKEERSYDEAGNVLSIVDAAGGTTSFTYDPRGRIASVTDPLGKLTQYDYDDASRQAALIDAKGNRTDEQYDVAGRLEETIYSGGDTETTTYDTSGRPTSRTNGNGETIEYDYDDTGLLTATTFPGGLQETYTYTVDRLIETVVDARGTTTSTYDPVTRDLKRVTEPDGRYVRYDYDLAGNRTLMAHALGAGQPEEVTTYTYDALSRLETVTDALGGVTTYSYDDAGNVTGIEMPNGTTVEQGYDSRNRLTSVVHRDPTSAVLESFTYTLDALGNRTMVTSASGSHIEYDYDDASRVTAERHYDPSNTLVRSAGYAYDDVGNLTERSGSLGSATYAYDTRNQLVSGGGAIYDYDGAGNLITKTAGSAITTFDYDERGRMTGFAPPSGSPTTYAYDFRGLRQRKTGAAGSTDYLVDRISPTGFAQVVRESDGIAATRRSYVHGRRLLARFEGGVPSYHHADGLGSTRLLTNAAGAVTDTFDYSAYGSVLSHTGSAPEPYQFAGEQRDAESSLSYLRARYYDPSIGRFLARDPARGKPAMPASFHKYLYANANPVNFTDPSGLETLASLQVSQSISNQQRRTQIQTFVRTTRQLTKFTGRVYQYLGALFSTIAAVEALDNKAPLRKYFTNIPVGAEAGFDLLVLAFIEKQLGTLSISMFSKTIEYETEALWAGGKLNVCQPNDYAMAFGGKFVPGGKPTIVLCGKFVGVPPLPTSYAGINATTFSKVSGMGIMVHEWAHLALKAIDDDYFCQKAEALPAAKQKGNADNYRCLVETYAIEGAKDLIDDFLGP